MITNTLRGEDITWYVWFLTGFFMLLVPLSIWAITWYVRKVRGK